MNRYCKTGVRERTLWKIGLSRPDITILRKQNTYGFSK